MQLSFYSCTYLRENFQQSESCSISRLIKIYISDSIQYIVLPTKVCPFDFSALLFGLWSILQSLSFSHWISHLEESLPIIIYKSDSISRKVLPIKSYISDTLICHLDFLVSWNPHLVYPYCLMRIKISFIKNYTSYSF